MTPFVPGGPPRYRHQRRMLRHLIAQGGVAAFLADAGTGKTAPTLDYSSLLALKSPTGEARVLVFAPLAAIDTWVSQAETYVSPQVEVWAEAIGGATTRDRLAYLAARGPGLHAPKRTPRALRGERDWSARARGASKAVAWHGSNPRAWGPGHPGRPSLVLEVLNLDVLSSRARVGSRTMADLVLRAVQDYAPDLVVVDESHRIKGHSSNMSRLAARIGARVRRRMILTGTVMPHSPLDVYAQWRFLDPSEFVTTTATGTRPLTWEGFRRRYAVMGGYMGHEVTGYRNLDDMQQVMARRAITVRKEDALDLPPTQDVVVPVHLSSGEQRAYDDLRKNLAAQLDDGSTALVGNRLALSTRLRQITAGHLPDDQGVVHDLGDSKARTVASLVNDTLAGEQRVVVFAYFTREIDDLVKTLSTPGTTVERIDGATSGAERLGIRRRFGDLTAHPERTVLVAQVRTVSLAVNEFVTARAAVFASLSQQRDDISQARDRLHRIGQDQHVTYYYALAGGTVDEAIYRAYHTRTDMEAAVLDHIRAVRGAS